MAVAKKKLRSCRGNEDIKSLKLKEKTVSLKSFAYCVLCVLLLGHHHPFNEAHQGVQLLRPGGRGPVRDPEVHRLLDDHSVRLGRAHNHL